MLFYILLTQGLLTRIKRKNFTSYLNNFEDNLVDMIKFKGYYIWFIVCIVIIVCSSKCLCNNQIFTNTADFQSSAFLPEDIIFEYNSTHQKQEFDIEVPFLELGFFNSLTLFFHVSGYQTNNKGLNVTFLINGTNLEFIISRFFQDDYEHNLTQTFTFPEEYSGSMNIRIICEGESNFNSGGSLRILNSASIIRNPIPYLEENPTSLPSYPDWLIFKGNSLSFSNSSVKTVFNNTHENVKLFLSLSFISNEFFAYSKSVILKVNNETLKSRGFNTGENRYNFSLITLKTGLNTISCQFNVKYSNHVIQISKISFIGWFYTLENFLPEDVVDWIYWKGNRIEHTFNLSPLKPISNYQFQILDLELMYGCIGTVISSAIRYQLYSNSIDVKEGEITVEEQENSPNKLVINNYLLTYNSDLYLRIYGSTEGEGIFYILDSSKISAEPIPRIKEEENYTRTLVEKQEIQTPMLDKVYLEYTDWLLFNHSTLKDYSFSLFYELYSVSGNSLNTVDVSVEIDHEEINRVHCEIASG